MSVKTKLIWFFISIIVSTVLSSTVVLAKEDSHPSLQDNLLKLTSMMEERITESYERALNQVEKEIKEKGYDYQRTMLTALSVEGISASIDYTGTITACVMIKEKTGSIYTLGSDFLSATLEEKVDFEKEWIQIPVFEDNGDGTYSITDYEFINYTTEADGYEAIDEEKNLYRKTEQKVKYRADYKTIEYGEVKFHVKTPEEILKLYDMEADGTYLKKKKAIENCLSNTTINQTVFNQAEIENLLSQELIEYLNTMMPTLSHDRQIVIQNALSLVGAVPYEPDGKARKAGYDEAWYTYNEDTGLQKGLDAEGFVSWVYLTSGYGEKVWSTLNDDVKSIEAFEPIEHIQLEAGDIGFLNYGENINHMGIYLGNMKGEDLWINCNPTDKTVNINPYNFEVFRRIGESIENDIPVTEKYEWDDNYEEVYLLAQTICHEAKGEGYNGWVGVAEVILNRINSPKFEGQNTVKEVIHAEGQFENSQSIETEVPTADMLRVAENVLRGSLKIFDNPDVCYFRNCGGDTSDWGNLKSYAVINHHTFYTQ